MLDGSGSGKSASYVIPNAYQLLGSYVFTDPKGELYDKTAGYLKEKGYKIKVLNLVRPQKSDGYNPLLHILLLSNKFVNMMVKIFLRYLILLY